MNCMKQRNRSPLEIRCDILSVLVESPQRKTWILYKANLNIHSLQRHLTALIETELISETVTKMRSGNRTRYTYCITPKGINALHHYRFVTEAFEKPRRGDPIPEV